MPSSRLLILIAAGACLSTQPRVALADPGADTTTAPAGAGSWINVDPVTGKRIPVPSEGVQLPADPAFSTSHGGLVEEAAPGGGVMVDLQGRFRSAATATVGPDGKAQLDCIEPGHADRDAHR